MPITRIEGGVPPSKAKYSYDDYILSGSLTPGHSDVTTICPPAGKRWQIKNMVLYAPAVIGATSGVHSFTLNLVGISLDIGILHGASVFGSTLKWDYSRWDVADSSQKPNTDVAAQNALSSTHIVPENPFEIHYNNATDATQTLTRIISLYVLESPLI